DRNNEAKRQKKKIFTTTGAEKLEIPTLCSLTSRNHCTMHKNLDLICFFCMAAYMGSVPFSYNGDLVKKKLL
ncbi:hypothetical protein HispidOSU_027251, partial [Sigmodon hispidus]